ncbi:MAG: amidase family protein, partial [Akkermansiaceae bacterium]
MTLTQLRQQFLSGQSTPTQALESLASAIAERDSQTKAYISYNLEEALQAAAKADLSKPLGGLPIAIKDNINTFGQPCTCGSKFLAKNYTSPYDATVIRKLKEAGAIPFGRMNMDEFAMGSATENSAIQLTRN